MAHKYVDGGHIEGHVPTTGIIDKIKKAMASSKQTDNLLPYVLVGYDIAMDLLTLNRENRKRLETDVIKLAGAMRKSKFKFIGAVIRIDKTMRLIDGQAELMAVVMANLDKNDQNMDKYSYYFHIQTNLEPDVYAVVDIGRVKTMADALKTAGYSDVNNASAAIRTIITLNRYKRIPSNARGKVPVESYEGVEWLSRPSNKRLFDHISSYTRATLKSKKENNGAFLTLTQWMIIYYMLAVCHEDKGKKFVTLLASGGPFAESGRDEAISLCYKKLMNTLKPDVRNPTSKVVHDYKFRYIFKAWNAWITNEKITSLKVNLEELDMEMPIKPAS